MRRQGNPLETEGRHPAYRKDFFRYEVHAQRSAPVLTRQSCGDWSEFVLLNRSSHTIISLRISLPSGWRGDHQYSGAGVLFVRSSTSMVRRSVGTRLPEWCRQKETSHGLNFKLHWLHPLSN
jgi:hypothetical protein